MRTDKKSHTNYRLTHLTVQVNISAWSKHHAVKMAYMDNWRSAPSILVLDAA